MQERKMINLRKLKKDEIIWMFEHKCKHNHNYLEHPRCYIDEEPIKGNPLTEKVGFLDIETTGLNANWDFIISYAIIGKKGKKTYGRACKSSEVLNPKILDRNLLKEFSKDIRKFDKIIVYYGRDRRHDTPFLRTRALKWRINFPGYGELRIVDAYDIVRNKLSLHRRRMENVANFLKIPAKEHRLDGEIWQRAKLGSKEDLHHIWLHNKEDTITLRGIWRFLEVYVGRRKTSI